MKKIKVLFLCTGNSVRSQIAEAFLRKYAGGRFSAYRAGLEPQGINPYTERVMQEIGIDLSSQYSKSVREYLGKMHFGYLITVCANAEKKCPTVFPGVGQRMHWNLEDPAKFEGLEEEKLQKFRDVRDQIDRRIRDWLKKQDIQVRA